MLRGYVCTFIFPKRYESKESNNTINLDKIIFIFGIVYEIVFLSNSYCEMSYIKNINTIFKAFVLHIYLKINPWHFLYVCNLLKPFLAENNFKNVGYVLKF